MVREPIEPRGGRNGQPIVHVHLKVVPGASRADLAGCYGDRVKVRVTAAAASGKANKAVLALLGERLGLPAGNLTLVRGATTPLKTVEILGLDAEDVGRRLLDASA